MKCYNCFITFSIPSFLCVPGSIFRDCLVGFFQIQKHMTYHKYLYKFILLIQCVHIYITNSMAVYHIALAIFISIHAITLYYYYHYYFNKTNSTIKITSYQINHMNTCCLCFFIRPKVRRDVLWYITVRPSVRPSVSLVAL
jgi:hypothetical protein